MKEKTESSAVCHHHRVGFLGLLITLGIVFGDIGTSPLYVMKAILHTGKTIGESTILGALPGLWRKNSTKAYNQSR